MSRRPPLDRCLAWQCDGTLDYVGEDPDNYNLQLLDQRYTMLNPEEHTAMVPQEHRERIENWFKGSGDKVNVLVCTPTLELGVDIGALDSVLLRNVPPLPANYWQRAGRAGRRNRMAVNVTYCRPASHDRSYFADPLRMLAGKVDPPAFNMRNNLLISKHIHASIITRLNQLAISQTSGLTEEDRQHIARVLQASFPFRVSVYLFTREGQLREEMFDVQPLAALIARHRAQLLEYSRIIFQQGWPEADIDATRDEVIANHIDQAANRLDLVVKRLRKRLRWAITEIQRLNKRRDELGTLDAEDDSHFRRCDRMVKKLKGTHKSHRRDSQGVDDINTFNLLASEGFLPGYGLDSGSVVGLAEVPYWQLGSMDFSLPRPSGLALREYVPGNLIYANGHRFVARRFHQEVDDEQTEKPIFEVNTERQALGLITSASLSSLSSNQLKAIPVCDVDLVHTSQISDEEETRFQMSVATYGIEQGRHSGGVQLDWGGQTVQFRRSVHIRMVNVGASSMVDRNTPELGYPVCEICGYSVSPLASERQLQTFREGHQQRCGKEPSNIGFYADVVADALTLDEMANSTVAYSVLEALRMAAA